jgi:hypothetical protein
MEMDLGDIHPMSKMILVLNFDNHRQVWSHEVTYKPYA